MESEVELTARSAKKRKASGLTPDNVDTVLDSALDIETLSAYLSKNPDAVSDPARLLAALKSVVNDPQAREINVCNNFVYADACH